MDILVYIAIGIGAYLIGSISPSITIAHQLEKRDIREVGSGNAGATNVIRAYGWGYGLLVFGLDVLKGAAATYIGRLLAGDVGMVVASIFAVVGHSLPVYYGFRGGRGVSTTLGVYLVIRPIPTLIMLAIVIVLLAITHIMSVTSITGVILEAVSVFILKDVSLMLQITVAVLAALVIIGHIPNIERLLSGEEKQLVSGRPPKREKGKSMQERGNGQ